MVRGVELGERGHESPVAHGDSQRRCGVAVVGSPEMGSSAVMGGLPEGTFKGFRARVLVSVEPGLLARADALARAHGLSRSQLVARGIGAVLAAMGLTVSDAFRLLLTKIAREKSLPFEPLVPNEATIEAMKAARRGEVVRVASPEALPTSLDAEC